MVYHIMFATYVTVCVFNAKHHNYLCHEFEMKPAFHTMSVCEYYRPKLADKWLEDPKVPFTKQHQVATRCAPWTVDPNGGIDL